MVDVAAATFFQSGFPELKIDADGKQWSATVIYGFLVHEPVTTMESNDAATTNQL